MKSATFLLIISVCSPCKGYGFDAGSDQGACGRPYRTSRMHQPPCDLAKESYCTHAGTTYPWHAVRRFIKENQGLMRRMYGDESHIEVLHGELRNEISQDPSNDDEGSLHWDLLRNVDYKMRYSKHLHEHNELYDDDDDDDDFAEEMRLKRDKEEARLLQNRREEIILNTKFIYGQDPGMQIKLKDLHAPKFRPTSSTTGRPSSTEDVSVSTNVNAASTTERVEEVKVKSKENETFVSAEGPSTVAGSSVVIDNETTVEFSGSTESLDAVDAETTTFGGFNDVGTEELGTTTTEANKKEHFAEVLFQDMDERPVASNVDFKVRGVNACPVKEEVVAPFWANNTRGEVLALLNLYPFEQYVHWEKCTYEHRQMYCREGCRCEQQYRLHRLLAYDPNNECRGIFSDWFRFPSCCVCKCYDMPAEFRVTSRSPRSKDPPHWFKKKKNGKQKYNNNNANKQHIN